MGLGTAIRAFFAAWGNSPRAEAIRRLLHEEGSKGLPAPTVASRPPAASAEPTASPRGSVPGAGPIAGPTSRRSDAIALLSTLQRESRLVDLLLEPLSDFTDAQVGEAARPCLEQARKTLQRLVKLQPLAPQREGEMIELPPVVSPIRFQWVGEASTGQARVVHPGWVSAGVELPQWTGSSDDGPVIAPIQIERMQGSK
jgi:hypothetical protein